MNRINLFGSENKKNNERGKNRRSYNGKKKLSEKFQIVCNEF